MKGQSCPICLSNMDDEKLIYKLDCNHVFHTDCIMQWFRKSDGQCPCCLDNPYNNDGEKLKRFYLGYWNQAYINQRCSSLRKLLRKNDCPHRLIKNFSSLKKKEEELKEIQRDKKYIISNQEYKSVVEKKRQLDRKIYNKKNTILKMKTKIIADYPTLQLF